MRRSTATIEERKQKAKEYQRRWYEKQQAAKGRKVTKRAKRAEERMEAIESQIIDNNKPAHDSDGVLVRANQEPLTTIFQEIWNSNLGESTKVSLSRFISGNSP